MTNIQKKKSPEFTEKPCRRKRSHQTKQKNQNNLKMGCFNSNEEKITADSQQAEAHADEKINMLTKQEASKERIKYKLLLLGAGECGKSTLLRQMRRLHGRDFSESELMETKPHLTQNVIEA
eukprot:480818_1